MPRSSAWGTSLTSTCALRHVPPPTHTHIYKHSDDFFKCTMAASLPGPWTPCLEFHGTNIKEKTFNFAHPCHLFLPTHYIFQNFHWNEYHIGCMFIFLINYVSSTMFFLIPQNGLGFIPENIEATINIYVQEHWFNWGGGGSQVWRSGDSSQKSGLSCHLMTPCQVVRPVWRRLCWLSHLMAPKFLSPSHIPQHHRLVKP